MIPGRYSPSVTVICEGIGQEVGDRLADKASFWEHTRMGLLRTSGYCSCPDGAKREHAAAAPWPSDGEIASPRQRLDLWFVEKSGGVVSLAPECVMVGEGSNHHQSAAWLAAPASYDLGRLSDQSPCTVLCMAWSFGNRDRRDSARNGASILMVSIPSPPPLSPSLHLLS